MSGQTGERESGSAPDQIDPIDPVDRIRAIVRELLLAHIEPPARGDAPLELPSLALVMLAEDLEQELNFVVAARDLVPENFGTIDQIVAYALRRRELGMSLRIFRPAALGAGARIDAIASFLPERIVSNADLVAMGAPLSDAEMVQLSGIRERRWVGAGVATSDLAVEACRRALALAKANPSEIDRLIVATVSPDHASPSAACIAQKALGLGDAPAFDVTASCSGFLYALDLAMRAVCTGDRAVLACAADVRSLFLDVRDRATCALFGDGAGAALLCPCAPGKGLLAIGLLADGSGAKSVYLPAGGSRRPASRETVEQREHFIRMEEGPQVYLAAVEGMLATADGLLTSLGLTFADIALVVPHQPNKRILDRLVRLAHLGDEKLFYNVEKVGNVSGATCAIALEAALRAGRVKPGDKLLLLAAGAGYTAGAALLLVDEELLASFGAS